MPIPYIGTVQHREHRFLRWACWVSMWRIGRERHRGFATEHTEENREVEELGPMPRGRWVDGGLTAG